MKVARFDRLLASTALGMVLLMSGHAVHAQQAAEKTEIVVPLPDILPPPTAKDFGIPEQRHVAAPAVATRKRNRKRPPPHQPPRRPSPPTAPFPTNCASWSPAKRPTVSSAARPTAPASKRSTAPSAYKAALR